MAGRMRIVLTIGATLFSLAIASGPLKAQEDPQLVAGAQKEGHVMLYGETITPTQRAIKDAFEKKYPGIAMEFIYLSGQPMMNRIMSEQDAGRYVADVLFLDAVRLPALREKGLLAQYVSTQQSHYEAKWLSDPPGYWIQNHFYPTGIMYNKQAVAAAGKVPQDWPDLLDPVWKGKIALVTPVANDLMLYTYAGLIRDLGEAKAFEFFRALAAQQPLIFGPGGIRVSQSVSTGEFAVGVGFIAHVYTVGGGENGSMAFASSKPVYLSSGPGLSVLTHAPHPNAARLLVDFINSREVQELLAGIGYYSTYTGVKQAPAMAAVTVSSPPRPVGDAADVLRKRLADIFEK